MIEKILLIIITGMLTFVTFTLNKMSNNSQNISTKSQPPSLETSIPDFENIESHSNHLPQVWQNLQNRGAKKIFLSYDIFDFSTALEVSKMLEKDGTISSVYLAPKDRLNLNKDDETIKALNSMEVFVILFSDSYQKSSIANQEYGIALNKNSPILIISPFEMNPEIIKYGSDILQITPENQDKLQEIILEMLKKQMREKINSIDIKTNDAKIKDEEITF
jgi:hypothetical protein